MKKIIENLKRNYYARKMYKAIKSVPMNVMNITNFGNKTYNIHGNEHMCFVNKKRLGKNFNNTKWELWLPQLMKEKYGLRFLKCEKSSNEYYKISFYKK